MFNFFRRQQPRSEIIVLLEELEGLLTTCGFAGHARWVAEIASSARHESTLEIAKRLNSREIWGGSGAIWELSLDSETSDHVGKLLQDIYAWMQRAGVSSRRARQVLRRWS